MGHQISKSLRQQGPIPRTPWENAKEIFTRLLRKILSKLMSQTALSKKAKNKSEFEYSNIPYLVAIPLRKEFPYNQRSNPAPKAVSIN